MGRIAETRIGSADSGAEVIGWLAARFTYADASRWAKYCDSGELLVNGGKTRPGSVLYEGDLVAFRPAGVVEPFSRLDYSIIHEDEDFIIVDKPAHLVCHPGGRFFENSLWRLLELSGRGEIHLASRLDRETSGVLAVCRSQEALRHWERSRAAGSIEKTYIAVVHGDFPESLEAEGFLVPDSSGPVRKKRIFIPAAAREGARDGRLSRGERCLTSFRLLGRARGLSRVEAIPKTGRTHQIRATLRSLGYPVLGDKLYGLDEGFFIRFAEGRLEASDKERLVLDRQALHSLRLRFPDRNGLGREYRAAPPPELREP